MNYLNYFLICKNPETLQFTCAEISVQLWPETLISLNIFVNQDECSLQLAPARFTTVTLAMGDALAIALMELRNLRYEQLSQFHPGGSLGKRLITKFSDVMIRDPYLCLLRKRLSRSLIYIFTEGKCGLVFIQEGAEIMGIVTDGDVRCTMESKWRKSSLT